MQQVHEHITHAFEVLVVLVLPPIRLAPAAPTPLLLAYLFVVAWVEL